MDADHNFWSNSAKEREFKDISDTNIQELLEGKDKITTQKATESALSQFSQYLRQKDLPNYETLMLLDLPEILFNFYPVAKPLKGEHYAVQTLKCLRSGLARYYRKTKGFDISKDSEFTRANEIFEAVCVDSKKNGKGVRKSYPPISQIDLERISEYFTHDHMNLTDPKKLQQQVIFYVIYYFCRRGRENLYNMLQTTFKVHTNPDGSEYVYQAQDEIDKNHGADDTSMTNEGKMYPTGGEYSIIF